MYETWFYEKNLEVAGKNNWTRNIRTFEGLNKLRQSYVSPSGWLPINKMPSLASRRGPSHLKIFCAWFRLGINMRGKKITPSLSIEIREFRQEKTEKTWDPDGTWTPHNEEWECRIWWMDPRKKIMRSWITTHGTLILSTKRVFFFRTGELC